MSVSAVIPAAGSGTRLGLGPKAWLELGGRTLVEHVIATLDGLADQVVVAVRAQDRERAEALVRPGVEICVGGVTRQETVHRMVERCTGELVLVQDAARPLASAALIAAVCDRARLHGAAAAFLAPDVPVARLEDGFAVGWLDRSEVAGFQAPQAFQREALLAVLRRAAEHGTERQSTAQLWLDAHGRLAAVPGEKTNLKITTAADWRLARALVETPD